MEIVTAGKITIKQIFKDHWQTVLAKHRDTIPDYVVNTVNKMLICRDPERLGYAKYACPDHPHQFRVVPHSCKTKFCSTCGVLATNNWMHKALSSLPNAGYYHLTITIPDYLWYFLKEHIHLLDHLFKASSEAVLSWFKDRKIIPAIVSALHSFGRNLKLNFHIHMIVSAGGLRRHKDKYIWKRVNSIHAVTIKNRFKAILLKNLKPYLDEDLKELLYALNWHAHASQEVLNVEFTCKYIGRYAKKPALAETRITEYDGFWVSFFYQDTKSKTKIICKLSAEEFILKLIQHILPPQFRVIRYYGLLANRVSKGFKRITSQLLRYIQNIPIFPSWRERQLKLTGLDPLLCPVCGKEMILRELAFFSSASGGLAYRFF
jgi:hypothetical protein